MNPLITARISKYEYTAMIACRAQQIANNAPTTLVDSLPADAVATAIAEYKQGVIPLRLRRYLSDGTTQVV